MSPTQHAAKTASDLVVNGTPPAVGVAAFFTYIPVVLQIVTIIWTTLLIIKWFIEMRDRCRAKKEVRDVCKSDRSGPTA